MLTIWDRAAVRMVIASIAALTFPDPTGRPQYLLDDREPIADLL